MRNILLLVFLTLILSCSKNETYEVPEIKQVPIKNNSFEERTQLGGTMPDFWSFCGNEAEERPNYVGGTGVFPFIEFSKRPGAVDGESYLILLVKSNDKVECINQLLEENITSGFEYSFSLFASQAAYFMIDDNTGENVIFNNAVKIELHGINLENNERLLAESEIIDGRDWKRVIMKFTVDEEIKELKIKAQYTSFSESYNGNVVIDDLRLIGIEV